MRIDTLHGIPAVAGAIIVCAAALSFDAPQAQGQNVAIVAAAATSPSDPRFTDPRDKLLNTGLFDSVDFVDCVSGTPTLADLMAYDAVITWSNVNYADAIALGDVMADYVDAGGGVVVATFANSSTNTSRYLRGRWISDGYEIIPAAGGSTTGQAFLGAVLDPTHPIMDGVMTFDGGTSSFRPTTTALTAHGVKIAEWTDGKTLVAVSSDFTNRADLGFYPPSNAASASFWNQATDGDLLMANALLYTISEPDCPADINGDGVVDVIDLLALLAAWGNTSGPEDINGDGIVDVLDLLELLGAWGPC